MDHIARFARPVDSKLFNHAGKDQIGLICAAVQTGDEQDRVNVFRNHTRVFEGEDCDASERLNKTTIREFPSRNFADANEDGVILLARVHMQLPIFSH